VRTPLVWQADVGAFLKLDYLHPSGSFKDRGAAILVSRIRQSGYRSIVLDSSGNAGAAMALYASAAGIDCRVFVPRENSPAKLRQIRASGAELVEVDGGRFAAGVEAARHESGDVFYANHNWSPDFGAGIATLAFELWEQRRGDLPSSVIVPCGNGSLVIGLWQGFTALQEAGLIDSPPALIAVQSTEVNPIATAWASGSTSPHRQENPGRTIAEGIACELPLRGIEVLRALHETGGIVISVNDGEIRDAVGALTRIGFLVEPTAAAAFAGLHSLRLSGRYDRLLGDRTAVVLTGHGLKSLSA
jgi:threonine synthase